MAADVDTAQEQARATERALYFPKAGDVFRYTSWGPGEHGYLWIMEVEERPGGTLVHGWVIRGLPAEAWKRGRWETWTRAGFVLDHTDGRGRTVALLQRSASGPRSMWYSLGQVSATADRNRAAHVLHGAAALLWALPPAERPPGPVGPDDWRPPAAEPYRAR